MKALRSVLCAVVLCAMLFSCGSPADEGIRIVPSSHTDEGLTSASVTETEPVTEAVTEYPVTTDAETASADRAEDAPSSVLAQAEALLGDEAFRQLLEQFGAGDDTAELVGAVAAVLAYQNVHGQSGHAEAHPSAGGDSTVYWTTGGSVWHVTGSCSALAKSKSILSGSESDALAAGKTRVCKRCGAG